MDEIMMYITSLILVSLAMQELLSAPREHWIHEYWPDEEFKNPANPALGET